MNTVLKRLERLNGAALDIGGTKIAAARIVSGRVLEHAILPTDGQAKTQKLIADCLNLLAGVGAMPEEPLGVSATGRVTASGEWSAVNSATLPNVERFPLAQVLAEGFSTVRVANDAAAAAWAEACFGAGVGASGFAYVTVSTGIGGGIVLNGRLVQSDDGLAGHVGFMTSRLSDTACGSGRFATVESVASGSAIARTAREQGFAISTAEVFERWRDSETWAGELVSRSAQAIADLGCNLKAALGIDRLVVGGSVGLAVGYLDLVREHVSREVDLFQPEIVAAGLGKDSPLFGALQLAIDAERGQ